MSAETIYDGPSVLANMRELDSRVPVVAKIEPLLNDTLGLIKSRWSDLTVHERRALETSAAGFRSAIESITTRTEAKAGQIGPRRGLHIITHKEQSHERS